MQTGNRNARKLLMDTKGRVFAYNGTELLQYDEQHHIFLSKVNRTMTNQSWGDCFIDAAPLTQSATYPNRATYTSELRSISQQLSVLSTTLR